MEQDDILNFVIKTKVRRLNASALRFLIKFFLVLQRKNVSRDIERL